MSMDIAQLEYFAEVAKTEHMSRSAEKLNISQPALSSNIRRLEEELGTELFNRRGNSISLNEKGRIFLDSVLPILAQLETAKRLLKQNGDDENSKTISIVASPLSNFPGLLDHIAELAPEAVLSNDLCNYSEVMDNLQKDIVDFCISGWNLRGTDICSEELFQDEIFVMTSPTHSLSSRSILRMTELQNYQFAVYSRSTMSGIDIVDICKSLGGFKPSVAFAGSTPGEVIERVRASDYVTLIPEHLVKRHGVGSNMRIISLANSDAIESFRLYWHYSESKSKLWQDVRNAILEFFKKYGN